MFLAGHMAVAHILIFIFGKKVKMNYSLPLIFAASLMPDLDYAFQGLIRHHDITHSLPFGLIFYIPFFWLIRSRAIPYFIATTSHYMLADVITGNPPLLFGLDSIGFGLFLPWLTNIVGNDTMFLIRSLIELATILIYVVFAKVKANVFPLFSGSYDIKHILVLGMVVFVILFSATLSSVIDDLSNRSLQKQVAYTILVVTHSVLLLLLLRGTAKNLTTAQKI